MATVKHNIVGPSSRHPINAVTNFADITARDAYTYLEEDTGKVVRVGAAAPYDFYLITRVLAGAGTFQLLGERNAHYYGSYDNQCDWTSTTWTGVHNVFTLTNTSSENVARANSDFTFSVSGLYRIEIDMTQGSYDAPQSIGIRLRRSGVTLDTDQSYADTASAYTYKRMTFVVQVSAGDVVTIEYAVSASTNGVGPRVTTLDSQAMKAGHLLIHRIGA